MEERKIIITGATSGLGEALARQCISNGYRTGLTGRRTERLERLRDELGALAHIRTLDVTKPVEAWKAVESLAEEMGGMDIIVLNSGVSNFQAAIAADVEQHVIDVNVSGFTQLASRSFDFFERQGHGHIVGISSVAGMFGYGLAAAYCASKAFVSNYMQGYRQRGRRSKADIHITDIRPGYVESEMTAGKKGMFWVIPADRAAVQMLRAIERRKARAFVPRRWALVGALIRLTPDALLDRL